MDTAKSCLQKNVGQFLFIAGNVLARYLETGCYRGFMKSVGTDILSQQHHLSNPCLWNIHAESDLLQFDSSGSNLLIIGYY